MHSIVRTGLELILLEILVTRGLPLLRKTMDTLPTSFIVEKRRMPALSRISACSGKEMPSAASFRSPCSR